MLRLSIIVPMYNVELYVERCIRTLENQDIPKSDYEIICVNDGSPDNCKGIVEYLQSEFHNIVLIDQKNQGVSKARNNAIARARGKYLLMIDPDDYVAKNTFERILSRMEESDSEVYFLGYTFLNEDDSVRKTIIFPNDVEKIYKGTEAYFVARGNGMTDPDRLVAVLMKREFISQNDLFYLSNVPYLEDGELMARIMCLSQRCIFDDKHFYQRTTRPGSATNSNLLFSKRAIDGFVKASISLKKFRESELLNEEQRIFLNQSIAKFVILAFTSCNSVRSFKHYHEVKKELSSNGLQSLPLESLIPFYRSYSFVYNFSPLLFMFLWKMPRKLTLRIIRQFENL